MPHNINPKYIFPIVFIVFLGYFNTANAITLLSDDFSSDAINNIIWNETDKNGLGAADGNVTESSKLYIRNSFSSVPSDGLSSVDAFSSTGLELSVNMYPNLSLDAFQSMLGYGDSNFQELGTHAYILGVDESAIHATWWDDGNILDYISDCGASETNSVYKIIPLSEGFEVYKNNTLLCSVTNSAQLSTTVGPVTSGNFFLMSDGNNAHSFSDALVVNSSYFVPGITTNISSHVGNTQVTILWTAPVVDIATPVTDYIIEYKLASEPSVWNTFSDGVSSGTSATVTGLTNYSEYNFRISAVNIEGQGLSSSAINATPVFIDNLLSDDFTGTTINAGKWIEVDSVPGGLSGNIVQNGVLSVANSYQNTAWGATSLRSVDTFSSDGLEFSANMTPGSSQVLGYGDYNFQDTGTQAFMIDLFGPNIYAIFWDNGVWSIEDSNCGTVESGANYKMSVNSSSFSVYKNNVFQCKLETSTTLNNKHIFLESSFSSSNFDNILVQGKTLSNSVDQVVGLSAMGVNKQVLLDWDTPISRGSSISDYLVEYKIHSSNAWNTFVHNASNSTKIIVSGLLNDTLYDFRISAVNNSSTGVSSSIVSATTKSISNLSFVFAGESNSGGIGVNASATTEELSSRSAVQIMNLTSGNFLFENLHIGINNLRDHAGLESVYGAAHGFELQLANATVAHTFPDNEQVYLVKTGQGSTTLSLWNEGGAYWTKFLQRTTAAKTQIPENRQWVVWLSLGINDYLAGTPVDTFKTEMIAHINKIKANLPGAIVVMTQFQSMPINNSYSSYNLAMSQISENEANVYAIDSTGAATDGGNHWNYSGLKTVSDRMITITKNALGLNLPGTPRSLVLNPSETSVQLSWVAPVSPGLTSVTDYIIEYKRSTDDSWVTFSDGVSTSTTSALTGLSSGSIYNFRVSAVNSLGSGNSFVDTVSTVATISNVVIPRTRHSGGHSPLIVLQNKIIPNLAIVNTQPIAKKDVFISDFKYGDIHQDIMKIQIYLNKNGFFVSKSGAGSVGKETTKFGPATKQALIKFQKSKGIFPANGNFGIKTRAYLNK